MQSYKEGEKWNDNNGQNVMGTRIKFYLLVSTWMIWKFSHLKKNYFRYIPLKWHVQTEDNYTLK